MKKKDGLCICNECYDFFDEDDFDIDLTHCLKCAHHYPRGKGECGNCHSDLKDMPGMQKVGITHKQLYGFMDMLNKRREEDKHFFEFAGMPKKRREEEGRSSKLKNSIPTHKGIEAFSIDPKRPNESMVLVPSKEADQFKKEHFEDYDDPDDGIGNIKMTEKEYKFIKSLPKFDLEMLLSTIHDFGWTDARLLLVDIRKALMKIKKEEVK